MVCGHVGADPARVAPGQSKLWGKLGAGARRPCSLEGLRLVTFDSRLKNQGVCARAKEFQKFKGKLRPPPLVNVMLRSSKNRASPTEERYFWKSWLLQPILRRYRSPCSELSFNFLLHGAFYEVPRKSWRVPL